MKGRNLSLERAQRHFEIVYLLLERQKLTAKELARYFEVSERTILRDISTIESQIPIYTDQGKGGGIFLREDFVLNKVILSGEEKETILDALHCVSTALDPKHTQSVLTKLSNIAGNHVDKVIEVDFSAWGQGIEEQFSTIKKAISSHNLLCFDYVSTSQKEYRSTVEPASLWFKDKTWYLKAYCHYNECMLVFRLSRMRNLEITQETFVPRGLQVEHHPNFGNEEKIRITLKIDASQKYRIYDDFLEQDIVKQVEDFFIVQVQKPNNEYTIREILSYGPSASVLEPQCLREHITSLLHDMMSDYGCQP